MTETDKKIVRIYMPLEGEGVPVIRPVDAEMLGENIYRVLQLQNGEMETWMFPPGSKVGCKKETWSVGEVLVAREIID